MLRKLGVLSLITAVLMVAPTTGAAAQELPPWPLPEYFTLPGQVAIFDANVRQIYDDSEARRNALGRRLYDLVWEERYTEGSIGYSADIFLLQELNSVQANDLADEFGGKNLSWVGVAASSPALNGTIREYPSYVLKSETAILYNTNTMELVPGSVDHIDHTYSSNYGCSEATRVAMGIALDLDGDGKSDCAKPKWKRTYMAEFVEKESGLRFAVASVHWVLDSFFAEKATAAEHKAQWAQDIATTLRTRYPLATAFTVGGDMNQKRCAEVPPAGISGDQDVPIDLSDEPKERTVCPVTPFWERFSALGFVDTVFAVHGQTDTRLSAQYRDGFVGRDTTQINYRPKRIDHIFTAGETTHSAASFDLFCGVGAPSPHPWNCRELTHPDAYSDHRIVWAFVGPVPRATRVEY